MAGERQPREEGFRTREETLAKESWSTAINLEKVSFFIDFPRDVHGLTILDVGGGASTATRELQERGAQAYAVDYAYRDWGELGRLLTKISPTEEANKQEIQQMRQQAARDLSANKPPGVPRSVWRKAIERSLSETVRQEEAANRQYQQHKKQTSDTFFRGVRGNEPKPYIAALAGDLPFQDGSFDLVYSLQCATAFLIKDQDVFMQSVEEQLRILKSKKETGTEGQLQFHPWLSDSVEWGATEKRNGQQLLTYLRGKDIPYRVERVNPHYPGSPRLRILKP